MSQFTEAQVAEIVEIVLSTLELQQASGPNTVVPEASEPLEVNTVDEGTVLVPSHRPFILKVIGARGDIPPVLQKEDGSLFQKYPRQQGHDWYWIGLGVSDVTANPWNSYDIDYSTTEEGKLENIRNYSGGLRQKLETWPADLRAVYEESHPEEE